MDRPPLIDGMRVLRLLLAWLVFVVAWSMLEPSLNHVWFQHFGKHVSMELPLPIDEPPNPTHSPGEPDCKRPDILQRSVVLDLRPAQASLTLRAVFDRCSPLLQQLRDTMANTKLINATTLDRVRTTTFSTVLVRNTVPEFEPVRIQAMEGGDTVEVITHGRYPALRSDMDAALDEAPLPVTIASYGRWRAPSTHVQILTPSGTGIWTADSLPTKQSEGEAVWADLREDQARMSLSVTLPSTPARTGNANSKAATTPVRSTPALIQALQGRMDALRPLVLGLGYGLPFAWLWFWAARQKPAGSALAVQAMAKGCGLALLLIVGLVVAETVERLGYLDGQSWMAPFGVIYLGWMAVVAKASFIAFIWPALASLWLSERLASPRAAGGITLGVMTIGLMAAMLALIALGGIPRLDHIHIALSTSPFAIVLDGMAPVALILIGLTILLATWWLAVEWAGWRASFVLSAKLILSMAAIWLLMRGMDYTRSAWTAAILALPFGWAFTKASFQWMPQGAQRLKQAGARLYLLGGALLVALLTLPPSDMRHASVGWLLSSPAWALAHLWQVGACLLLAYWMLDRAEGTRQQKLPIDLRQAACAFLVMIFFWRANTAWAPMLASLWAGYLVARHWVFAPRALRVPQARHRRLLQDAIQAIGLHNDLGTWRQGLHKSIGEQLAKGDLSIADAMTRRQALQGTIALRSYGHMRARARTMLALNLGSGDPAPLAAKHGAMLATLLSLPWIASYCMNVSRGDTPLSNAYAISQLGSIVLDLIRWPALGFFFMYFYPHLRGRNGIEKGLSLAAGLILPSLLATVLWSATANNTWLSLLFWSLQVFICCMTIGVGLGDIGALHRAGKGPRSLVDIYKLGTLAAWSSSLALAVGAAATTVLASQAGSLFTAGLKLLLPDLPPLSK